MSFLRNLVIVAPITLGGLASAETVQYGSLRHYSDVPSVLFLTGEIKVNDSFELRRAMRDQTIDLVVMASPGGNLYEGLQIAAILHDNGIGTYVPQGASCESSCANILLGGFHRLVVGELGVHQFYSSGQDANATAPQNVTTSVAQYTTADIIGIMNQFDTPPFVYEKMFGTTDIYYFKASEKPRLNLGLDDAGFSDRVVEVDNFLAKTPSVLERLPISTPATPPANAAAEVEPSPQSPTMEDAAATLIASVNDNWSLPNDRALPRLAFYYAPFVDFYGNSFSQAQVLAEKNTFAARWPIRDYRVEPDSVRVSCTPDGCIVDSVIAWEATSPERGAKAAGRSTWSLVLISLDGRLQIASESGKTLKRK